MALKSLIEWTDATWNPVTGCSKVSDGCSNCYAERMALRLRAMGNPRYQNGFSVTLHQDLLDLPCSWRKPRKVFVTSMGDLFHDSVPSTFISEVFHTMQSTPQHQYQLLTKRPERASKLAPSLPWPENVWMGTTIESSNVLYRIDHLREIPASVLFISAEPLLTDLEELPLQGIDWVIVGGESGPGARPMKADWVRSIRDQCLSASVAFFFKQWGGTNKRATGRILDGCTWDQMPQTESKRQKACIET